MTSDSSAIRAVSVALTRPRWSHVHPGTGWAALGVLVFSFTFPATHLALEGFSPTFVGAGRSVIAAVAAAGCLLAARAPLPARSSWPGLLAVAAGVGIGFGLLTALALPRVGVGPTGVVTGLLPIGTAASAAWRAQEHPSRAFWVTSLLGAALVVGFTLARSGGRLDSADVLLLVALVVGAIGYAEGGRLSRTMPGWQVICWAVLLALPVSLPVTVIAALRSTPHPTPTALAGLAYVSLVSMLLGFFAWNRGLATAGIARASQLQLAQPLLTLGWAALLLGEHVGPGTVAVAIGVLTCVAATQRFPVTATRTRPTTSTTTTSTTSGPEPEPTAALPGLSSTPRTRLGRHPERGRSDRAALLDVLDAGRVAHVGVVRDGNPLVLPMAYGHDGRQLFLHASAKSRFAEALTAGAPVCVTVTVLDGLVLAARAFSHSMNYRSAVIFGRCVALTSTTEKSAALDRIIDTVTPGRSAVLPPHTRQELRVTTVFRLDLDEASVKMRSGGPVVPPPPTGEPWTGVIPLSLVEGRPIPQT